MIALEALGIAFLAGVGFAVGRTAAEVGALFVTSFASELLSRLQQP